MNITEINHCLELINKYVEAHGLYTYNHEMNLAKMACSGIMKYTEGGTISKIVKVYLTEDGNEGSFFTFAYENYDVRGEQIFLGTFLYENTEIKNFSIELFDFAFNECVSKLNL